MVTRLLLTAAMATAILAAPAPFPVDGPARCDDYGECVDVDVFGYRVQRLVNTSSPALGRRQDDARTNVEVGSDNVVQDVVAFNGADPGPTVFGELWDRIAEACLGSTCNDQSPVEAAGYQLNVGGQFPDVGARDNFIALLREAFFRAYTEDVREEVQTQPGPPSFQSVTRIRTGKSVDFLNANIFGGENSGQFMTVRVTKTPTGDGCGPAIDAINAGGALVPYLAPFFGIISVACAAIG